jgi:hypothetical protein
MNNAEFRDLMREAVGNEQAGPWLSHAVRTRIAEPAPRTSRAPLLALLSACIALAVIAVAIAPRFIHLARSLTPAVATPSGVDPTNCTLPVIVYDMGSNNGAQVGFVDTHTGAFSADGSASSGLNQLPSDQQYVGAPSATEARYANGQRTIQSYSAAAHRWLPVPPERVSPDGLSYVYTVQTGPPSWTVDGSAARAAGVGATTLMRYDIGTGTSSTVWAPGGAFFVDKWTTNGILVNAPDSYGSNPAAAFAGSPELFVDPETGVTTPVHRSTTTVVSLPNGGGWEIHVPIPNPSGSFIYTVNYSSFIGFTEAGDLIQMTGTWQVPSAPMFVYYDQMDGKRVYIYDGVNGNQIGFDGDHGIAADGEIWFATFLPSPVVWHWDPMRGLGKLSVNLEGSGNFEVQPVGACF